MQIKKYKNYIILLSILAVGSLLFYAIGNIGFAIVYAMLWIDKIIIGKLKMPLEFGIELFSIPAILVGIMYGPTIGFLFAFFAIPIIGGILDFIATGISRAPHLDTGYEPFFPSPESFISGIIAVIGSLLKQLMPFFFIVLVCMSVRFFMNSIRMPEKVIVQLINFGLNIGIAFLLQNFFISILGI